MEKIKFNNNGVCKIENNDKCIVIFDTPKAINEIISYPYMLINKKERTNTGGYISNEFLFSHDITKHLEKLLIC